MLPVRVIGHAETLALRGLRGFSCRVADIMALRCAMREAEAEAEAEVKAKAKAKAEAKAEAKAVVIPAKAGIHSASRKDTGSMLPRG